MNFEQKKLGTQENATKMETKRGNFMMEINRRKLNTIKSRP